MTVAVDFDGTLIEQVPFPCTKYQLKPNAEQVIRRLHAAGITFVLCSARYGWYRWSAILFIKKAGLPIKTPVYQKKPCADIYVDDRNIGTARIDWLAIEKTIQEQNKNVHS